MESKRTDPASRRLGGVGPGDAPRKPEGEVITKRVVDRSTRIPLLAYAFVILSLVVLAITPTVIVHRLATARKEGRVTFDPARRSVHELQFIFEHEVAELRAYVVTGADVFLDSYLEARTTEQEIYQELTPLVERIGPAAGQRLQAVRQLSARWHVLDDALATGRVTLEQYTTRRPQQFALNDSTLMASVRLEEEIERAANEQINRFAAAVALQRTISLALGAVAIGAALVVGWFARRERTLSERLARAVQEQTRLKEEAQRRRTEIERLSESRARLMRGFSHDVKNPLGAADGYLQLLQKGIPGQLNAKQTASITRSRRSIEAALHLIEDLLELARVESGRLELAWVLTNVRDVAREAAEEYRAQAQAKGLRLDVELDGDVPLIESDPGRVRQVLGNIISNAVKYTERGAITLGVSVRSDGRAPGPGAWIAVDVSDTGPGIAEERRAHLFDEFTRVEGGAGSGVGLAISRRIALALGGDVSMTSEVGRGSTFTLWLPTHAVRGSDA